MVTDGNQIYCGHYFVMYTNIESCCIPETNVRFYVNSTSIKKKKKSIIEKKFKLKKKIKTGLF